MCKYCEVEEMYPEEDLLNQDIELNGRLISGISVYIRKNKDGKWEMQMYHSQYPYGEEIDHQEIEIHYCPICGDELI